MSDINETVNSIRNYTEEYIGYITILNALKDDSLIIQNKTYVDVDLLLRNGHSLKSSIKTHSFKKAIIEEAIRLDIIIRNLLDEVLQNYIERE